MDENDLSKKACCTWLLKKTKISVVANQTIRGGIPRYYRCMLPAKVKDFIYKVSVHMCSERLKRRIVLWLYNKNFDLKNFGNFLIKVLAIV